MAAFIMQKLFVTVLQPNLKPVTAICANFLNIFICLCTFIESLQVFLCQNSQVQLLSMSGRSCDNKSKTFVIAAVTYCSVGGWHDWEN